MLILLGSPLWNDVITGATLVYDSNPAPESAGPSGWKNLHFQIISFIPELKT